MYKDTFLSRNAEVCKNRISWECWMTRIPKKKKLLVFIWAFDPWQINMNAVDTDNIFMGLNVGRQLALQKGHIQVRNVRESISWQILEHPSTLYVTALSQKHKPCLWMLVENPYLLAGTFPYRLHMGIPPPLLPCRLISDTCPFRFCCQLFYHTICKIKAILSQNLRNV